MPVDELTPIAGDPFEVAAASSEFHAIASRIAETAHVLRGAAAGTATWTGDAAIHAHARSATLPPKLDKVTTSYAGAASALGRYASTLSELQSLSKAAIASAERASQDLRAAETQRAAAAAHDAATAAAAHTSGQPPPAPTAQRYNASIDEAVAQLARASASNTSAHEQQCSAAHAAALQLKAAAREGIRNEQWWRHVVSDAAHWATTQWVRAIRTIARLASTVSAIAGLAALALAVAGVVFPPLEAAAAVLETISLVAAVVAATGDATLAATGNGSWATVGVDALNLAPAALGRIISKAAPLIFSAPLVREAGGAVEDEHTALGTPLSRASTPHAVRVNNWSDPRTLSRHFLDHGGDFEADSADEYANRATRFLHDARRLGYPTKIANDGTVRIYDPGSNTFGCYDCDGNTVTLFKPTSPTYWDRQKGRLIEGPVNP